MNPRLTATRSVANIVPVVSYLPTTIMVLHTAASQAYNRSLHPNSLSRAAEIL